jgi:hypothetical protein
MHTKEIIQIIHESALNDEDLAAIIAKCTQNSIANALIGAGMDLLAEKVNEAADAADTAATDED